MEVDSLANNLGDFRASFFVSFGLEPVFKVIAEHVVFSCHIHTATTVTEL